MAIRFLTASIEQKESVPPLDEGFKILRLMVEAEGSFQPAIAVSSAVHADGSTRVAGGLARAFAEAGHPTLLVDARPKAHPACAEVGIRDASSARNPVPARETAFPRLYVKSLPVHDRAGNASLRIGETVAAMCSQFSVTIIDTPPLVASSMSIEIARAAANVLLAFRLGRRLQTADHELRKLLCRLDLRVIGIVPTRFTRASLSPRLPLEDFRHHGGAIS